MPQTSLNILAIIPARKGSKGIKMKNIKLFRGKELIYWSIDLAKRCKYINRTILSTDGESIRDVGLKYGAEVPFLRPESISQDLSPDEDFIKHCIHCIEGRGEKIPDIIVQLRPTYPTRKLSILNDCIETFIKNWNTHDSLRTVYKLDKSPYKMYRIEDDFLVPLFQEVDGIREPYNQCRQLLPTTYIHNGYIDIMKTATILNKGSITGDRIYPYVMSADEYHDIDSEKDWTDAENGVRDK